MREVECSVGIARKVGLHGLILHFRVETFKFFNHFIFGVTWLQQILVFVQIRKLVELLHFEVVDCCSIYEVEFDAFGDDLVKLYGLHEFPHLSYFQQYILDVSILGKRSFHACGQSDEFLEVLFGLEAGSVVCDLIRGHGGGIRGSGSESRCIDGLTPFVLIAGLSLLGLLIDQLLQDPIDKQTHVLLEPVKHGLQICVALPVQIHVVSCTL